MKMVKCLPPKVLPAVALALALTACADDPTVEDGGVLVLSPAAVDPLVQRQLKALPAYLKALSGLQPALGTLSPGTSASVEAAAEEAGAGLVLVLDAQLLAPDVVKPAAATSHGGAFTLTARDVGDWPNKLGSHGATLLYLGGDDKLARQYALWEALRRLGARFYHPEQEYLPKNDPGVLRLRARTATALARKGNDGRPQDRHVPDFTYRGFSFHGSHPLEHLEAFSDGNFPIDEAANVNDWIVKSRGNEFRGAGRGVADAAAKTKRSKELTELKALLGFPAGAGISLHNQQQGANAVVDPTSSVTPQKQIEDYVAARVKADSGHYRFGIHFGPTEFTVTPDKQTLDWINWAGRKALSIDPKLVVEVNNHTTGSQAVDTYGDQGCPPGTNSKSTCDYYDLAFHTDPRFGVKVHTVMFYPLEGPAYVYNQKTFAHKLCLMKQASAKGRPMTWFPEGSWWLSFDNPIPVYLPLYIWTRGRDVELLNQNKLIAGRGGGTVKNHRMFNSGHEWGYWQQDYAVGLWHWNVDVTMDQALGELFDPLCEPAQWQQGCAARTEAVAVLKALMKHQKDYLLDKKDWQGLPGGLYAYLAGEDPADEIAAATGFEFRPVRVSFAAVARWSSAQLSAFRKSDLAALTEMDSEYKALLARLKALQAKVPAAGRPWLDEVVDGVENNMLRARHTAQLYEAILTYRAAQLAKDPAAATKGEAVLAKAKATLAEAQVVIRRREKAYRYPAKQMYGGGVTAATAVPNGTTYPFRVHTKTHLLTYWNNRQERAKQLLAGQSSSTELVLSPVLADPGQKLTVSWPQQAGLTAAVTVGSKSISEKDKELDLGSTEGYFAVAGKMTVGGSDIPVKGGVVRAASRAKTPSKGLTVVTPSSALAQSVLNPLFPPIIWAVVGASGTSPGLALAPDLNKDGAPSYKHLFYGAMTLTGGTFTTQAMDVKMPFPSPSAGGQALTVGLNQMVLSGKLSAGKLTSPVRLEAQMVLGDLVQALIDLAGFDSKGALNILSGVLGFDAKNPPKTVKIAGDLKVN